MKILFDHQIFSSQTIGGISRYHVEIAKRIDAQWDIPLFFSNNLYLKELRKTRPFFPNRKFKGKNRLLERINRLQTVSLLKKGDFDVFHPTFYGTYSLRYLKNHPLVFTLHDMIHDRYPELPAAFWEKKEKRRMAKNAAAIIVPSRFTADELMALYQIPAGKIHVVHHGGPGWRLERKNVVPHQFLFVGGRNFYKNFFLVLQAMTKVPESTLLAAGAPFDPREQALISQLGLSNRVRTIYASEEELPQLYASSAAFIFPSLMEGFGLPVLEAFAAGCPALLADIPVFREIAGDTALYFDPGSPVALSQAMQVLMTQKNDFDFQKQLAHFSWEKCAAETLEVYKTV